MFFTYILLLDNHTYYTGITNNLQRRLSEHNSGQCISTRGRTPVKLVYHNLHLTRIMARKQEIYIKRSGARRFLNKLQFSKHGSN